MHEKFASLSFLLPWCIHYTRYNTIKTTSKISPIANFVESACDKLNTQFTQHASYIHTTLPPSLIISRIFLPNVQLFLKYWHSIFPKTWISSFSSERKKHAHVFSCWLSGPKFLHAFTRLFCIHNDKKSVNFCTTHGRKKKKKIK